MKIKFILLIGLITILFNGCNSNKSNSFSSNHLSLLDCQAYIEKNAGAVSWDEYKSSQGYLFGRIKATGLTARCDKYNDKHWGSTYHEPK